MGVWLTCLHDKRYDRNQIFTLAYVVFGKMLLPEQGCYLFLRKYKDKKKFLKKICLLLYCLKKGNIPVSVTLFKPLSVISVFYTPDSNHKLQVLKL